METKTRKCYLCGISGHISSACPTPNAKNKGEDTKAEPAVVAPPTPASKPPKSTPSTPAAFINTTEPTTSRKCYNCGQTGHMSSLCPAKAQDAAPAPTPQKRSAEVPEEGKQVTSRKCYGCGLTGHMSADCPSKQSSSSASFSSKPTRCGNCGVDGHPESECPLSQPKPRKSLPPSSSSTSSTASSSSFDEPLAPAKTRKCYNCGQSGHMSSACPTKQQQQPAATTDKRYSSSVEDSSSTTTFDAPLPTTKTRKCYNCGQTGHVSSACPSAATASNSASSSSSSTATPSNNASSDFSGDAASATTKSSTRKCYNCGQSGHVSSACPTAKQPTAEATGGEEEQGATKKRKKTEEKASSKKCYKCGEPGHMSSSCPMNNEGKAQEGASEEKRCQMCKEAGHVARNCPNKDEKMACYNCGSKEHFAKECPEEKKPDERTCHECGEVGHITRNCPSVKRFRKKDSGKDVCFVCESSSGGHLAKDCPSLEELKKEFAVFLEKYHAKTPVDLEECVKLLQLCSRAMEINGSLFLYNYLVEQKVALTEQVFDLLFHIYSRIGLAHSVLPALPKTGLAQEWPRDQLRRIVKSRKAGTMSAAAGEELPRVLQYLEANPRSFENLFKLATFVSQGCQLSNKQARTAVLLLHSQGALAGVGVTISKKHKRAQGEDEDESLLICLQKEFPDKADKWAEWLRVLQEQDLSSLKDLRGLDAKDLDSLPVSAALRSGLRRLQQRALLQLQDSKNKQLQQQQAKEKEKKNNNKQGESSSGNNTKDTTKNTKKKPKPKKKKRKTAATEPATNSNPAPANLNE